MSLSNQSSDSRLIRCLYTSYILLLKYKHGRTKHRPMHPSSIIAVVCPSPPMQCTVQLFLVGRPISAASRRTLLPQGTTILLVHINTVRPYTCHVFEHRSTLTDSHETMEALGRVVFLERPSTLLSKPQTFGSPWSS